MTDVTRIRDPQPCRRPLGCGSLGERRPESRPQPRLNEKTVKRSLKIALIAVPLTPLVVIGLTLATTATVNAVATGAESSRIETYGELVPVGDRRMNVVVSGDGDQTVVLLPGLGTAAPALDFAPLIDALDDTFRVVAVEPFGTGLSDQTDVPRTAANIADEVHEALQWLGIDRYALMGHSISGIYAITYVERFRDEVTAFVGIDSSVPGQPGGEEPIPTDAVVLLDDLGITRALRAIGPDPYRGAAYDDATKEQMRILTARNTAGPTMVDEMADADDNFADASGRAFPADLPLLLVVRTGELDVAGWVELHEHQAATADIGEVVLLDGDHYLHRTLSPEIAAETARFLAAAG